MSILFGVIALTGAVAGWRQDLVVVAPGAARVEFENALVRVVRLKMPAHTSSPMHDRPARVVDPVDSERRPNRSRQRQYQYDQDTGTDPGVERAG